MVLGGRFLSLPDGSIDLVGPSFCARACCSPPGPNVPSITAAIASNGARRQGDIEGSLEFWRQNTDTADASRGSANHHNTRAGARLARNACNLSCDACRNRMAALANVAVFPL